MWLHGLQKKDAMQVMEWVLRRQAVYLDYADAIKRYGKIEVSKQGLDNVTSRKSY